MANLNFRYGLYQNLDNAQFNAGTIYVTTDEKALYVDLPNGTSKDTDRIRIGQTIVYDSAADFVAVSEHPEFSPEGFYYVEEANMLLRWKGGNKTVTKDDNNNIVLPKDTGWIQINSVSDVQADLEKLTTTVDTLNTNFENLKTAVGTDTDGSDADTVFGKIAALVEAIGDSDDEWPKEGEGTLWAALNKEIARATAKENAIENKADKNATDIAGLADLIGEKPEGVDDSLWEALVAEIDRATKAEKAIDDKVGKAGDAAKADGSLYARLAAEIARATEAEGVIATAVETEKTARENAVKAEAELARSEEARIEGLITKLSNKVAEDIDKAETGLKAVVAGHTSSINTLSTELSELQGVVGDSSKGLVKDVAEQGSAIDALEEIVNGKEGTEDGGLVGDVADLKEAVAGITDGKDGYLVKINKNAADIADLKQADIDLDKRIDALEATVDHSTEGVKANYAAIGELKNAINGTDGLAAKVAENTTNIGTNATAIETNKGNIGKIDGRLKTIENAVNDTTSGLAPTYAIAKANQDKIGSGDLYGEQTTLVGAVKDLNTRVNTNATQLAGINGSVKDYVDSQMAAADAMEFKGSITALSGLPTTGVEKGWTYVVGEDIHDAGGALVYRAGDMLVANEDQAADVASYPADGWTHVKTGTWKESQALKAQTVSNDVSIALSDGSGSVVGSSVIVKGEGVSVSSTSADSITITLAWSEF